MQRVVVTVLCALVVAAIGTQVSYAAEPAGAAEAMVAVADGQPMLEVTKECPKLRYVGRDATFTITVKNKGNGPAYDVVVTDVINGQIEFKSADNEGKRQGNNVVWQLGTLGAGESRTLKVVFGCNHIGPVGNKVTVNYCAEASDECEMEVKGIPAILLECVDDPDPIELNSTVTYTITVVNQGSAVGTNIVIECTLPEQEEYVSSTGPTEAKAKGKKIVFAPVKSLAPKATVVYKVTVKGVGVGDVRFGVQLKSDQVETPVMETESTHIYD